MIMHYRNFRFLGLLCVMVLQLQLAACGGGDGTSTSRQPPEWPIAQNVYTTAEQQINPIGLPASTPQINPRDVPLYEVFGYSAWQVGPGLAYVKRTDLAPGNTRAQRGASFVVFHHDRHPYHRQGIPGTAELRRLERDPTVQNLSSAYSPVILSTTHVLDAAVQTINALHEKKPFDFGISLGDTINNTQYNELRWYIDVLDGKVITPSSGAHVGADTIDYQKPYKAAGLNKAIPWYQTIGNHDQF